MCLFVTDFSASVWARCGLVFRVQVDTLGHSHRVQETCRHKREQVTLIILDGTSRPHSWTSLRPTVDLFVALFIVVITGSLCPVFSRGGGGDFGSQFENCMGEGEGRGFLDSRSLSGRRRWGVEARPLYVKESTEGDESVGLTKQMTVKRGVDRLEYKAG